MIITLCRHEDGRPVAMIPATGKKEDREASEARAILADPRVRLENALITADPLHNKEPTLRVIVEKGGDYLIGTKGNTSKRLEAVEKALESPPLFDLIFEEKNNHGRIDRRRATIRALTPVDAGLLSAHKRDHHIWQEDRHRQRRVNIAQSLVLTRNALLAITLFDERNNLPSLVVDYQNRKQLAIDLILKARPLP